MRTRTPLSLSQYGVKERGNELPPLPYVQPDFTGSEAIAMRALAEGGADARQQRLVWDWIFWASRYGVPPIILDEKGGNGLNHDAMIIVTGQQLIARWIVKMVKWRPPQRSDADDEHGLGTS